MENDLRKAVYNRIKDATITGIVGKSFPNKPYSGEKNYIRTNIIAFQNQSFSFSGKALLTGIVQVDVVIKDGIGEGEAIEIAEQIINLFLPNLYLMEGTTQIGFLKRGSIGASLTEQGSYTLPIQIPYTIIGG